MPVMEELVRALPGEGFGGELRAGEPMARHGSLGVGGTAALYAVPRDEGELALLLARLQRDQVRHLPLGGGTNLLVPDQGFPGCLVRLGEGFKQTTLLAEEGDGLRLEAGGAVPTPGLLARCGSEGWAGVEFLAGIPGTLGGAARMNAGTREGEMAQAVTEMRVWQEGRSRWLPARVLRFSYRSLDLPPGAFITALRFRLRREEASRVRGRVEEAIARRRATQPRLPSLGCWFRNPQGPGGGDSAGRLIEAAGLKGARVGGAVVSPLHANFLVREGEATASDFLALAEKVKSAVAAKSGVALQEEIHVAR